jgi:hypothetical protein
MRHSVDDLDVGDKIHASKRKGNGGKKERKKADHTLRESWCRGRIVLRGKRDGGNEARRYRRAERREKSVYS